METSASWCQYTDSFQLFLMENGYCHMRMQLCLHLGVACLVYRLVCFGIHSLLVFCVFFFCVYQCVWPVHAVVPNKREHCLHFPFRSLETTDIAYVFWFTLCRYSSSVTPSPSPVYFSSFSLLLSFFSSFFFQIFPIFLLILLLFLYLFLLVFLFLFLSHLLCLPPLYLSNFSHSPSPTFPFHCEGK